MDVESRTHPVTQNLLFVNSLRWVVSQRREGNPFER